MRHPPYQIFIWLVVWGVEHHLLRAVGEQVRLQLALLVLLTRVQAVEAVLLQTMLVVIILAAEVVAGVVMLMLI
jgi:hypothetical protein